MQQLEEFDELCNVESDDSCTGYFKPAVEKWIQDKLMIMKDKAAKCV